MPDALARSDPGEEMYLLMLALRRNQAADGVSDDFRRKIAKHVRGRLVPTGDRTLQCLADDGVAGGLHNRRQVRAVRRRPFAFDELTQLAPKRGPHLQEILIRLPNLAAEAFHDAKNVVAQLDRKAKRGVQSLLHCRGRPRKIAVLGHVRNPRRLAVAPDASRQTDRKSTRL